MQVAHPEKLYKHQLPLTRVRDLYSSTQVELLSGPQQSDLDALLTARETTHALSPRLHVGVAPGELEERGALWIADESLHFTFLVNHVTRILTHQLVRQRIGVTFFQQCTGDTDLRHADLLIPRGWTREMENQALVGKIAYAHALDHEVALPMARYLLPTVIDTHLVMHISLAALVNLFHKRVCPMTQIWEMVLLCHQLAQAVQLRYPYLAGRFYPTACQRHCCWWWHNRETPMVTPWWAPDVNHLVEGVPATQSEYHYPPQRSYVASLPKVFQSCWRGNLQISEVEHGAFLRGA